MWSTMSMNPYRPTADKDYKIGLTQATMLRLRDMGVPAPDQAIYQPFTTSYVRGDLSRVGDGVATIEWTWDILATQELAKLLRLVFVKAYTTTTVTCYIQSDYRTGDYPAPSASFDIFQVKLWRPEMFGQDGSPVMRTPHAYQSIRFKFMILAVI